MVPLSCHMLILVWHRSRLYRSCSSNRGPIRRPCNPMEMRGGSCANLLRWRALRRIYFLLVVISYQKVNGELSIGNVWNWEITSSDGNYTKKNVSILTVYVQVFERSGFATEFGCIVNDTYDIIDIGHSEFKWVFFICNIECKNLKYTIFYYSHIIGPCSIKMCCAVYQPSCI